MSTTYGKGELRRFFLLGGAESLSIRRKTNPQTTIKPLVVEYRFIKRGQASVFRKCVVGHGKIRVQDVIDMEWTIVEGDRALTLQAQGPLGVYTARLCPHPNLPGRPLPAPYVGGAFW